MSLFQIYPKIDLKKNRNIFIIIVIVIVIAVSCNISKPNRVYKQQYKIIDYVFMPEIDSILTGYLSNLDYKYYKKRLWIELENHCYDSIETDYCIYLHKNINNTTKKLKFRKIGNNQYLPDDLINFLVSKTNRYAVINKGKYVIPVVVSDDRRFAFYGSTDYSIRLDYITGCELIIKVKDWKIVEVVN